MEAPYQCARANVLWRDLFLYAPCPVRHGARYNPKTLEIDYRGKTIADVPALTVEAAWDFFADAPNFCRSLPYLMRALS